MVGNPVFEGRPDGLQADIDAFTTDPSLEAIFSLLGDARVSKEGVLTTYTRLRRC